MESGSVELMAPSYSFWLTPRPQKKHMMCKKELWCLGGLLLKGHGKRLSGPRRAGSLSLCVLYSTFLWSGGWGDCVLLLKKGCLWSLGSTMICDDLSLLSSNLTFSHDFRYGCKRHPLWTLTLYPSSSVSVWGRCSMLQSLLMPVLLAPLAICSSFPGKVAASPRDLFSTHQSHKKLNCGVIKY